MLPSIATPTTIPDRLLFTPLEVADILGVCLQTIYNWHNDGRLPCVKRIGHPIRIHRDVVLKLLQEDTSI